ncbi:ADP-ribosylase [Escherichia phage Bp7]|uniref:NAD(+)--arginine ADP-ribosyltransferase n=1 Tax=Escherichia phage Bp7 TaxID=1052121 RepID=G3MV08_9CAUD|nr:Alt-like RNA polymerase ADP-ribosyltransferase [Escherichia phage Bp7]AEN93924.1 ADP-ribosylase [Escherichia phage Bp7]
MMENLNEVFDSDSAKNYPVINLKPGSGIPQIFSIKAPGNDNLVARMVSYASQGDAIKMVKPGDKYVHVILMSLSSKGAPAELKGGLGSDPLGTLNTIFDTVYEQVNKLKMDAVLFRFPTKKMKGKGPTVQRVLARLAMARTGGKFKVVDAMYQFTGKHTYVLLVRRGTNIEDIKGMPEIDAELYTKVESKVGEVYVSKETGQSVSKAEAVSASIAKVEEKRTDKAVITKTKISRRAIAMSQSLESSRFETPMFKKFDSNAAELNKPATAPLMSEANEIKVISNSFLALENTISANTGGMSFKDNLLIPEDKMEEINTDIKMRAFEKLHGLNVTSVKALENYASVVDDVIEEYKGPWLQKLMAQHSHLGYHEAVELAENSWNAIKTKIIQRELRVYALTAGWQLHSIIENKDASRYTPAQKRGIREYVGSGYEDMNNVLLGLHDPNVRSSILTNEDIEKAINNLDSAFENGERLPPGITLYRSQRMIPDIYLAMISNKVFYFRNFVSTAIYPNIFGTWMTDSGVGLLPDEKRRDVALDKSDEGLVYSNKDTLVGIGWAFTGTDKVNVVLPGGDLAPSNEMEVILPRGLMVKINKITDASYNNGTTRSNNKFVQAEVMTADELNEAVVYDGDALMETGELVVYKEGNELSFDSFVSNEKKKKSDRGLGLLASCIDIDALQYKFVQG